jgi:hypothetical protein
MKKILLPFLLCLTGFAFAQVNNSPFLHQRFDSELTAASKKTTEGKYYQNLPIPFDAGDVGYIIFRSADFMVLAGFQDTTGNLSVKQDEAKTLKATGSELKIPIRPPFSGMFNLIFSTKEAGVTGKFSVDLYLYRKKYDRLRNAATPPFSDKLKYLISQKFLGFEFVKQNMLNSILVRNYAPTVKLFEDADCKISELDGSTSYECTFTYTSLGAANKKFDELEKATETAIGPTYKKYVYTSAQYSGKQKEQFVREVNFVEPGLLPVDIDPIHLALKRKSFLSLKITTTSKPGEYNFTYMID